MLRRPDVAAAEVVEAATEDVGTMRKGVVVATMVVVGTVEVVALRVLMKMGRPAGQPNEYLWTANPWFIAGMSSLWHWTTNVILMFWIRSY